MAEFPTYEEMAKNVAEKALDDFLYNGKSIREWMQIIASEDCISREAILNKAFEIKTGEYTSAMVVYAYDIRKTPSIQPKAKTDVLDKIKAEIEEQVLESLSDGGDDWFVAEKVNECLEIIDKYKADIEVG